MYNACTTCIIPTGSIRTNRSTSFKLLSGCVIGLVFRKFGLIDPWGIGIAYMWSLNRHNKNSYTMQAQAERNVDGLTTHMDSCYFLARGVSFYLVKPIDLNGL